MIIYKEKKKIAIMISGIAELAWMQDVWPHLPRNSTAQLRLVRAPNQYNQPSSNPVGYSHFHFVSRQWNISPSFYIFTEIMFNFHELVFLPSLYLQV